MALDKWKDANSASKVKGPVRCHKCQLKCIDAHHYLSHKCEPTRYSDFGAFGPPISTNLSGPSQR
jgi:hypothetical protein